MNPKIKDISEDNNIFKFTLFDINVSLANAVRRIILNDINTKFCRLDRGHFTILNEQICDNIKNGKYSDYHCCRPFKQYEIINNKIYELL